jgi:hypothetical protein
MDVGPVELIALVFPGERADPTVAREFSDLVAQGKITVLDLVHLTRTMDGQVEVIDVNESLDDVGFGELEVVSQALISEDDLDLVRDALDPGTSAAIVVYEHTWARRVAGAVGDAGGQVALHVQVPRKTVEAAIAAAMTG